jgi:hypothetical protein
MYAAACGNSAKAEAVRHVRKHAGNRSTVEAAVSRIQRSGEGSQSDDPNGQAHVVKVGTNFLMKTAMSKDTPALGLAPQTVPIY